MQRSGTADSCANSNASNEFSQGRFGATTLQSVETNVINILKGKRTDVVVMEDGDQSICSGDGGDAISAKKKDRGVSCKVLLRIHVQSWTDPKHESKIIVTCSSKLQKIVLPVENITDFVKFVSRRLERNIIYVGVPVTLMLPTNRTLLIWFTIYYILFPCNLSSSPCIQ